MGGKPSRGTTADKRLKANKGKTKKSVNAKKKKGGDNPGDGTQNTGKPVVIRRGV
jgi:hypothetical protein